MKIRHYHKKVSGGAFRKQTRTTENIDIGIHLYENLILDEDEAYMYSYIVNVAGVDEFLCLSAG
jgi:hypothetical protein